MLKDFSEEETQRFFFFLRERRLKFIFKGGLKDFALERRWGTLG